jgi:hypothetical protein
MTHIHCTLTTTGNVIARIRGILRPQFQTVRQAATMSITRPITPGKSSILVVKSPKHYICMESNLNLAILVIEFDHPVNSADKDITKTLASLLIIPPLNSVFRRREITFNSVRVSQHQFPSEIAVACTSSQLKTSLQITPSHARRLRDSSSRSRNLSPTVCPYRKRV